MIDIEHKLHSGHYSCVIKKGNDIRTFSQRGIFDLYDLYTRDADFLKGAAIADKIVGKGAAAIMSLACVKKVYADVMSITAKELLEQSGVVVNVSQVVPYIKNREGSGWCPVETLCFNEKELSEMFRLIGNFVNKVRTPNNIK